MCKSINADTHFSSSSTDSFEGSCQFWMDHTKEKEWKGGERRGRVPQIWWYVQSLFRTFGGCLLMQSLLFLGRLHHLLALLSFRSFSCPLPFNPILPVFHVLEIASLISGLLRVHLVFQYGLFFPRIWDEGEVAMGNLSAILIQKIKKSSSRIYTTLFSLVIQKCEMLFLSTKEQRNTEGLPH